MLLKMLGLLKKLLKKPYSLVTGAASCAKDRVGVANRANSKKPTYAFLIEAPLNGNVTCKA